VTAFTYSVDLTHTPPDRLLSELKTSVKTFNASASGDCRVTGLSASARCPHAAPCCGSLSGDAEASS
jgi:hypothetical protein